MCVGSEGGCGWGRRDDKATGIGRLEGAQAGAGEQAVERLAGRVVAENALGAHIGHRIAGYEDFAVRLLGELLESIARGAGGDAKCAGSVVGTSKRKGERQQPAQPRGGETGARRAAGGAAGVLDGGEQRGKAEASGWAAEQNFVFSATLGAHAEAGFKQLHEANDVVGPE